jgi:ABC-type Fe3+/spermidine/putrescine transport system ATPase subunit
MISLKSVRKKYGDRLVLEVKDIDFKEQSVYAILGPNGSGKSTMLKILAGVERDYEGQVCFATNGLSNRDVAYLPQKPYLFDLTVMDNMLLGIKEQDGAQAKAFEALQQVGMESFSRARMCSLSGGEAQRVALARTLVCGCGIILLDEPASSVDVKSMKLLEDCIKNTARKIRTTLIFTTHNPSQALRLASEVIILIAGEIADKGNPEKVIKNPSNAKTSDFLENWRV